MHSNTPLDPLVHETFVEQTTLFFTGMMYPQPDQHWPAVTVEQAVDCIADAVFRIGEQTVGKGDALVTTLLLELQARQK